MGSQVAFRLAGSGSSVALLEQKTAEEQAPCCTGIVSEECLREFEIDERLVYCHCRSATLYSPSGKKIRLERASDQAAILNRPAFNTFMAERASRAGADYIRGARVADITIGKDKASVTAALGTETNRYEAEAVVIATGSNSTLSKEFGPGAPGNVVGGAQAEVETTGVAEVEVYFGRSVAPDLFAWLVPISENKALAGLLTRRKPREYLSAFIKRLEEQGKITSSKGPISSAALPLKAISRSYAERLLVVGTAAGLVKPTTGGGIYYGLLSAEIAADTLRQALASGDMSQRSLSFYEQRWRKKLGEELKAGSGGRAIFEHLNDKQVDRAFDIMGRPGRMESFLAEEGISFDWHSKAIADLLRQRTLAKLINGTEIPFPGRGRAGKRPFTEGDGN